jgi:hypothetical protein
MIISRDLQGAPDSVIDVVAVGGGPGKSTVATLVANQGHSVLPSLAVLENAAEHSMPLFDVGLVPSTDGLRWSEPASGT